MTTFFQSQYSNSHVIYIDVDKTSSRSIDMWDFHVRDKFIVKENFFEWPYIILVIFLN